MSNRLNGLRTEMFDMEEWVFYYGSAGREKEMTRFVTFQEACNKEREVALF